MRESSADEHYAELLWKAITDQLRSRMYPDVDYDPDAVRRLWQAVVNQALGDAGNNCRDEDEQMAKSAARAWLLYDNTDFPAACLNAGYEPHVIRGLAQKAIRRGYVFRKPPKNGRLARTRPAQMELRLGGRAVPIHMVRAPRPRYIRPEIYQQLTMTL